MHVANVGSSLVEGDASASGLDAFLLMPPFRHRDGVSTGESAPSFAAASSSVPRECIPATATSSAERSKEKLVGPVTETTRDHKNRHFPFNESCPRCHWIKKGDQWSQKYGRVPEGRRTPLTGEYWCMPRQPRRGGQWALGCTVCALVNESYSRGSKTPGTSAKH